MNKEIVLIMGYLAAGKSTLVEQYVKQGYTRLNRDLLGGSIDDLAKEAYQHLTSGSSPVVLDNTYPSIKSRKSIVDVAKKLKIPIRCIHLTTSLEDAQLNTCLRMIKKIGRLLQAEDFKSTKDPNLFPPAALFHYRKEFETPTKAEGFNSVELIPFVRKWGPEYINKALILDYDGTLRTSTGPLDFPQDVNEIQILPGRSEKLKEYQDKGYRLLGASNQSGIARGTPREAVVICFEETNHRLGVKIDYQFCPHRIPPISCFCRKPHVGIGAWFIEKYKLLPSKCIMVGDQTTDKTFAERCGFQYINAEDFFQ